MLVNHIYRFIPKGKLIGIVAKFGDSENYDVLYEGPALNMPYYIKDMEIQSISSVLVNRKSILSIGVQLDEK